jgi:hypothetical protein
MFHEGKGMILLDLIHCLVHKCLQSRRWPQFFIWNFFIIKFYGHDCYGWKFMLHQEEMIFVNHISIRKIDRFKWKNWERIKPCTYSQKNSFASRVPSLPWLVFTSLIDIGINNILELDQSNHVNALDVEEIMHQTRFHVIKFDRIGRLKQNW